MDRPSLAELFAQFERPVLALCRRILGPSEDGSDAAQDCFLKIVRFYDRYDPRRPLRSWVFKIATNACLDILKRRRPELPRDDESLADLPDPAPPREDFLIRREDEATVHAALQEMPAAYRVALDLKYVEGLDSGEIREILVITEENLRVRLYRAKRWLREALARERSPRHELP